MAHVSNSIQGRQLLGGLPSSIDIPIFPFQLGGQTMPVPLLSRYPSTSTSVSASSSSSSTSTVTPSTTSSLPSDTTTPVQPLPSSHTVTVFQSASTSSAAPSTTAVAAANKSFLQNKVLSGIVFALVGVIGLVLLILLATFAIRRRRNKKLIMKRWHLTPSSWKAIMGPT
ncbi:hypothetical protein BDZ97DRAFT_14669 [Flammula alnicola]|nr:hypothetical protein BDZ97DRAFT_14669 [Flammula alnicola]